LEVGFGIEVMVMVLQPTDLRKCSSQVFSSGGFGPDGNPFLRPPEARIKAEDALLGIGG
jgi:hypothetical protein